MPLLPKFEVMEYNDGVEGLWEGMMDFNYEKEAEVFAEELNAGKYSGGWSLNSGSDYQQEEQGDITAFENFLNSDAFKSLDRVASE